MEPVAVQIRAVSQRQVPFCMRIRITAMTIDCIIMTVLSLSYLFLGSNVFSTYFSCFRHPLWSHLNLGKNEKNNAETEIGSRIWARGQRPIGARATGLSRRSVYPLQHTVRETLSAPSCLVWPVDRIRISCRHRAKRHVLDHSPSAITRRL